MTFVINKISDDVANSVSDEKWNDVGLIYWDILPCRQILPFQINGQDIFYKEKAAELKEEIRKTHPGRTGKLNRKVYIKKLQGGTQT